MLFIFIDRCERNHEGMCVLNTSCKNSAQKIQELVYQGIAKRTLVLFFA